MFKAEEMVGLDFETYSGTDLSKHGLRRYTEDPTFRPLIASTVKTAAIGYMVDSYDFITKDKDTECHELWLSTKDKLIVAHNAGFEQRVLQTMGFNFPASHFIDSAVVARACGAAGKLEAAGPQLLDSAKMPEGRALIQLFSIPGALQEAAGTLDFDPAVVALHPDEWETFGTYCALDARLSLRLAIYGVEQGYYTNREHLYQGLTMDMNSTGWHVDVACVQEMQRRYLENLEVTLEEFRAGCDAAELNLNSLKQLKEWCADRGIKASSFDEAHVAKLATRIEKKLDSMSFEDPKHNGYAEVLQLMRTKQALGGSSLKKLAVILDTVGADDRLYDQYLHVGAGQTYRTAAGAGSGRSVQMQNLKRLAEPADMDTLVEDDVEWTNDELALNIRQVFKATDPNGSLIVGDFSSVESRGLAWLAGAQWKLDAYAADRDMYKVLAQEIYPGVSYDNVTKEQRTTGKVGELSCGYGAGPDAVRSFATGMGVEMSEAESARLVSDWREVNPEIVTFWKRLDEALHDAYIHGGATIQVGHRTGHALSITHTGTPVSLVHQLPGAQSLLVELYGNKGTGSLLKRVFHGCHQQGRNIGYFKPSQLKNGDLWSNSFVDPKSKERKFYTIYGGKLAGILTQSFCRELFFDSLRKVAGWAEMQPVVTVIGQFHDEIVLEYTPGAVSLSAAADLLKKFMSDTNMVDGFPLAADVKYAHRYIK